MYYALILLSVVMFGGGFGLNDIYRRKRGSSLTVSLESTFVGSLAGFIILLMIEGFNFELTPFTLLIASLNALNGILFTFFSFRALDTVNLSLFSIFAMLGGMMLPFLQGILFYNESITLAKVICVLLICAALACTVERGDKKRGLIFCIGIFVLNGMSGVLSKIYTSSELPKASAAGYSALSAAVTVLLAGIAWLILRAVNVKKAPRDHELQKSDKKVILQACGISALQGSINKVANFLLVLSLVHVDASLQYPMVTGGTMIVSTVISCFSDKKPGKREIISVALSFVGVLALFLLK